MKSWGSTDQKYQAGLQSGSELDLSQVPGRSVGGRVQGWLYKALGLFFDLSFTLRS